MNLHETLGQAMRDKKRILPEDIGKKLLSNLGISVPNGTKIFNPKDIFGIKKELRFPLVLKAIETGLIHKTDKGAVRLSIQDLQTLQVSAEELWATFPKAPLLVEEMIPPGVELIVGLNDDKHFGPLLMVGTGGILTEVFQDIAFLVLPATRSDIESALRGLRGFKLLTGFRGKPAYDIDLIVDAIERIAMLGMEAAGYYESIDINPLLINENGATALDVKVVLRSDYQPNREACQGATPVIEGFFTPRSVVIVGASFTPGKAGHEVIRNIIVNGFSGKLYLVNPKGGELLGFPVYTSIDSVPEGIDLSIIILPAKESPKALREVARKGVQYAVLSAGGFAEVDECGARVQQELVDVLRETGIKAIGPNTAGHISTPHNFTSTFFPCGKIRRGSVSYITQTGNFATHSMRYILTGEHFGVARVIGLGNKIDVEESSALQYLADDPETKAVLMYLESIKEPKRFFNVARNAAKKKPIVLLKSGVTEAGKNAAAAHTAAMASEDRIIEGMLRQAGIVRLTDYTDLILMGKAFSMLPLPRGNRVSFLAPSGAMLVCLSDLCVRLGLNIPEMEPITLKRLQEFSLPFIRMRNPVDMTAAVAVKDVEYGYRRCLEAVLKDSMVDAVVPILLLSRATGVPSYDFIVELAGKYPEKPILVSFSGDKDCMDECKGYLEPRGIPTFQEIEQPFKVLSVLYRCSQAINRGMGTVGSENT